MHLGDLDKRLQQRLAAQTEKIEQLHAQALEQLKQSWQQEYQSVHNTITTATAATKQQLNAQLKWYALLPAAMLLSLCGGFLLGSWAMGRSLAQQARQLQTQREQIQTQQRTLERLQNQTWGVELYQSENGKFLILPPETDYPTDWRCNGKPCLKL